MQSTTVAVAVAAGDGMFWQCSLTFDSVVFIAAPAPSLLGKKLTLGSLLSTAMLLYILLHLIVFVEPF